MVRTQNVSKHFVDRKGTVVKAVDGVTFEAVPGKVFGLLGVNGAGKTTVLRILSTILRPTGGSAEVAGYDTVKDAERVRASIGFMSTSTALYGRLTAREVILYFGGLYGLEGSRLTERLAYVTDRLDLGPFADRLCDKLSTGQKQRVNIARTILHDPPVLFFDEPTAGLDIKNSQVVMQFIEEARTAGKTIIFSTHIMSEVERLCDHVAVIDDGVLKAEGSVEDIKVKGEDSNLERAFLNVVGYQPETGLIGAGA